MSKRHSLALLPLLSILAISPTELQRMAQRGIASEVEATQVTPAKEEVKAEVKPENKKEEVKAAEVKPEDKKEEVKAAEVKPEDKKEEVKKEETKTAVLVVDKKEVKKEEKKDEKKEEVACEHENESKVLNEQVKLLISQQSTITSNFNQLQQILQQMSLKQIELEYKMMNTQLPQPFPQMNTYGNWNQFQPNLIPSSMPQIPYGMGMYGSPLSQSMGGGMGGQYMGSYGMGQNPYESFSGHNPYAPVMQNQSPVGYFGNYQPQTQNFQHDPRYNISPVRPGNFGIDNLGFNMSSAAPQMSPVGMMPSQIPPQLQPQTAPLNAGPTYTVAM